MTGPQALRIGFTVSRAPLLWRDRENALWPQALTVHLRNVEAHTPWEPHHVEVTGMWSTTGSTGRPVVVYPATELHRAPGWVALLTGDALELAEEVRVIPLGHEPTRRVSDPAPVIVAGVVTVSSGWDDPGVPLLA